LLNLRIFFYIKIYITFISIDNFKNFNLLYTEVHFTRQKFKRLICSIHYPSRCLIAAPKIGCVIWVLITVLKYLQIIPKAWHQSISMLGLIWNINFIWYFQKASIVIKPEKETVMLIYHSLSIFSILTPRYVCEASKYSLALFRII